jgi:hypothetical protein
VWEIGSHIIFLSCYIFGYSSALSSSAFERLCLLFNIGALHSQIASAQNLHSDDGLKLAAKMFQVCFSFGMGFVYPS